MVEEVEGLAAEVGFEGFGEEVGFGEGVEGGEEEDEVEGFFECDEDEGEREPECLRGCQVSSVLIILVVKIYRQPRQILMHRLLKIPKRQTYPHHHPRPLQPPTHPHPHLLTPPPLHHHTLPKLPHNHHPQQQHRLNPQKLHQKGSKPQKGSLERVSRILEDFLSWGKTESVELKIKLGVLVRGHEEEVKHVHRGLEILDQMLILMLPHKHIHSEHGVHMAEHEQRRPD